MDICHLILKHDVIQSFVSNDKTKIYYRSYDRLVVINIEPTKETIHIQDDAFMSVINMQYLEHLNLFIIHKMYELIIFDPLNLLFTDLPVCGKFYYFKVSPDNKYIYVETFNNDVQFQLYHNLEITENKINNVKNVKNIDNDGNLYYQDNKDIIKYNSHTGNKVAFNYDNLLPYKSGNKLDWNLTNDCKYLICALYGDSENSMVFTIDAHNMKLMHSEFIHNSSYLKIMPETGHFLKYEHGKYTLYNPDTFKPIFKFSNNYFLMANINLHNNFIIIQNPKDEIIIFNIKEPEKNTH